MKKYVVSKDVEKNKKYIIHSLLDNVVKTIYKVNTTDYR